MISISHKYLPDSFSVTCSKESFVRRHLVSSFIIDLQPSEGVLIKKWSENMQQIYRRTPMQSDFIEVTLWHGCFPWNFQNIFRISFDKNTYRRLLLVIRIKAVLHGTICMIRFVWLLFGFKISSYNSEEIELILSFENGITQILMQKVVTILRFARSD